MSKAQHILLLLSFFYVLRAPAQNIGGVVNTYYRVTDIVYSKSCVVVSNAAGLAQFDNAMLIQMKGATVSTADDNNFGTVTSINDAGNYEMVYICSIRGDSVFFMHELLKTYTASGKVQLVRVPEYSSATVTSPLMPAPWNNTIGTGGVLAIRVLNTLTLNDNITADTLGFRGGASRVLNGTCGSLAQFERYYYNTAAGSTGGGYKGEGIVDLTNTYSGGRGPAANGGGGGNDHNNGAGGGSNLSAGGMGGINNSTTGCNNKYPGVGGRALSNAGNRIYLGGGGGNGHGNNTLTPHGGGSGGGIIYIKADAILGNSHFITARGKDGAITIGDGSSGGGAGGTIIMDVNNYLGTISIIGDGGDGGIVDNLELSNRSMGPGGGGAGGVIYFTGAEPMIGRQVDAGLQGNSANTNPDNLEGVNGATSGIGGSIFANYTVPRSVVPAAYCSNLLLPMSLLYFDGFRQQDQALLSWAVTDPMLIQYFTIEYATDGATWSRLQQVPVSGTRITQYKQTVSLPSLPANYYRLKVTGRNNQVIYSKVVVIKNTVTGDHMGVYPNPVKQKVEIHARLTGKQTVQLFAADGKLVYKTIAEFYNNSTILQLPALQHGVYIIDVAGIKNRLLIN
jgi:hypothetical protein